MFVLAVAFYFDRNYPIQHTNWVNFLDSVRVLVTLQISVDPHSYQQVI